MTTANTIGPRISAMFTFESMVVDKEQAVDARNERPGRVIAGGDGGTMGREARLGKGGILSKEGTYMHYPRSWDREFAHSIEARSP
jgi:hypothetical protein